MAKLSETSALSKGLSLSGESLSEASEVSTHGLSKGLSLSGEDLASILLEVVEDETVEQAVEIIVGYSSSAVMNRSH